MNNFPKGSGQEACQVMTTTVGGKESVPAFLRRRTLVVLRQAAKKYRNLTKPEQKPVVLPENVTSPLSKGDLVRVRPLKEINETLDYRGFTKGCYFMGQMEKFCEQEFRVAGSLEKFFDEARCRTLTCKNLFLLAGIHCSGESVGGCDRSCYLFWRREWLEKIG